MSTAEMCLFNVKDGFLGRLPSLYCQRRSNPSSYLSSARHGAFTHCSLPLAEGVVRGYKLGLLTAADYNNLSQCENLEDIKLYLVSRSWLQRVCREEDTAMYSDAASSDAPSGSPLPCHHQTGTDYAQYVSNEAGPLHTTTLVECCTRKLVDDWEYLRQNVRILSLRNGTPWEG